MTRVYLTDRDYEILNSGDLNEIKRHFNSVRGELVELQTTVKAAVHTTDASARACELRKSVSEEPKA